MRLNGKALLRALCLILALCPMPAAALEYCEDLWFTRNLVFDRAGYCFGSALGQAVFGNEGCIGKTVTPAPHEAAIVARVQALERAAGCRVNTSGVTIQVRDLEWRRTMSDLPVATEFQSSCSGYRGASLPLRHGTSYDAPVALDVPLGTDLLFEHEDEGRWIYIQVLANGTLLGAGWSDIQFNGNECEVFAG